MIVPSARVWEEMGRERAGFWPSLLGDGRTHAFLLKLPTHVIKAAYGACPMSLLVSAARTDVGYVLSTAVRVADDPASPLILTGVHRHKEEQDALRQALSGSQTMICFYDELARPVLRGECVLESAACEAALRDFHEDDDWYVGPWSSTLVKLLDEIQGKIDPDLNVPPLYHPTLNTVPLTLVSPEIIQIVAIGSEEVREVRLEGRDEGYGLEQGVWHLLEGLFGRGIYHSPQVQKEGDVRELTDVLCFGPGAAFLVESKAVAVLSTDPERSTERRARTSKNRSTRASNRSVEH